MNKRKIKVEWEKLKQAFDFHSAETTFYLNVNNGKVALYSNLSGGFDEFGNELNEKDSFFKKHYIEVPGVYSYEAYRDIERFIDSLTDEETQKKLRIAVKDKLPIVSFKEALELIPAVKQQWLVFKEEQLRRRVSEWLEEHGLELDE